MIHAKNKTGNKLIPIQNPTDENNFKSPPPDIFGRKIYSKTKTSRKRRLTSSRSLMEIGIYGGKKIISVIPIIRRTILTLLLMILLLKSV